MTTTTAATTAVPAQQVPSASTDKRTDERSAFTRGLIIVLAALAVLTFAVAAWQLSATNPAAPASGSSATSDGWAASRPGGSIYDQQVPRAAADQWVASRPGGSIYDQQVPRAAADRWVASRPGGSIYDQQVPRAGR